MGIINDHKDEIGIFGSFYNLGSDFSREVVNTVVI